MNKDSLRIYDRFHDIGFSAGIITRGPWKSREDPYILLNERLAGKGAEVLNPRQVHGSSIVRAEDLADEAKSAADGVLSIAGRHCLSVRTADCLPLLFAEKNSGLFGAVHIGWRGLVGGIIENLYYAVKNLDISFNRLYISLGPCIGDCCFEAGGDVAIFFEDGRVRMEVDKHFLDLRGAVKERLLQFGADEKNIFCENECTSCRSDRYYSFRRDHEAPYQMISFIYRN